MSERRNGFELGWVQSHSILLPIAAVIFACVGPYWLALIPAVGAVFALLNWRTLGWRLTPDGVSVLTYLDSYGHIHHWNEHRGLRTVQSWLCYRYDLSCGMTKAEARS